MAAGPALAFGTGRNATFEYEALGAEWISTQAGGMCEWARRTLKREVPICQRVGSFGRNAVDVRREYLLSTAGCKSASIRGMKYERLTHIEAARVAGRIIRKRP